jgi:hypothetical protein
MDPRASLRLHFRMSCSRPCAPVGLPALRRAGGHARHGNGGRHGRHGHRRAARGAFGAVLVLGAVLGLGGCAAEQTRPAAEPAPARARVALATLHVDNRTERPLTIIYRAAGRATPEVAVGRVDARAVAELAPVPAGEPLVLIARTSAGAELVLAPRSLAIGQHWTWRIPADAVFAPPPATEAGAER